MTSDDLRVNSNVGLSLKREIIEDLKEAFSQQREEMKEVFAEVKNDFYKNIDKAIRINTENGWCITGQMDSSVYIGVANNSDNTDSQFKKVYESEGFLAQELTDILDDTPYEWKKVIEDCFSLIHDDRFRVAIPLLMSFVEFKIARFIDTDNHGGKLKSDVKRYKDKIDKDRLDYYIYTAVLNLVLYVFFKSHDFNDPREKNLNRNWLQHGRDNPREWSIVDVYKILSLLSGISFLNEKLGD